jgi:hypothetical protein
VRTSLPHRNDALADFRLQLIRDSAFATGGRDIAIEWANALHQDLLDRYVGGADVPLDTLRRVWRDAVVNMNGVFDSPVYEEFVVAVRELNRRLPGNRRIRVLACDPPIDWTRVRTDDDILPFDRQRDSHCAGVLEREVLARGRTALLIIGGGHVLRAATPPGASPNTARLLEDRHPGSVFVITTRRARDTDDLMHGWTEPAFIVLHGTAVGRDQTELGPFETIADGFLFLRRGRDVEPDPAIYDDTAYRRELDRRWCIAQARPFPAVSSARTARPSHAFCH